MTEPTPDADALGCPTHDDLARLLAIHTAPDDRARAARIRDYWRDGARADRTPRGVAYLHLDLLAGVIARVGWP